MPGYFSGKRKGQRSTCDLRAALKIALQLMPCPMRGLSFTLDGRFRCLWPAVSTPDCNEILNSLDEIYEVQSPSSPPDVRTQPSIKISTRTATFQNALFKMSNRASQKKIQNLRFSRAVLKISTTNHIDDYKNHQRHQTLV